MKYLVIGTGRMAAGIIYDLLHFGNSSKIYCCDISEQALEEMKSRFGPVVPIEYHKIGASDRTRLVDLMHESDGVISAVPYEYNLDLTKWAIEHGCHFVDLGGNNTVVARQFQLNDSALRAGVGIIPDCGLAPGMTSVIVADAVKKLDTTKKVQIRVGGLPLNPRGPLKYMLVFSVHGLTNEYIEPAIILENAAEKRVDSMTGLEELEFPEPFGKLEAFYTSGGTSTLPQTYRGVIQHLDYKTIRYKSHCDLFKAMIDLDFTAENSILIHDKKISRREIFERLLIDPLTYESDDVVLIRVTASGQLDKKNMIYQYQAIEYGDKQNNLTAMMRTTAFPAALSLEMLADERITDRGVLRQEQAIPSGLYIEELKKRKINYSITAI